MIIIKENKSRIQAFTAKNTYELKAVKNTPTVNVSVFANMDEDSESDDDEAPDHDKENCEVLFDIND